MANSSPFRVDITADTKRTIEKLTNVDAMKDLRREMTVVTSALQAEVKQAARDLPSSRKRVSANRGSLRSSLANAVGRVVRLSGRSVQVEITSRGKGTGGGLANLARVVEGELPWRHPTYGHDPIVNQAPTPYFFETLERGSASVESAMSKVLSEVEKDL